VPDSREDGSRRDFTTAFQAVVDNVEPLACLLAGEHLLIELIEDAAGVGMTSLARCFAASIDASRRRIPFTAGLLPSDITGVSVRHQASGESRASEAAAEVLRTVPAPRTLVGV
jgi:MoxR-like ATPase